MQLLLATRNMKISRSKSAYIYLPQNNDKNQ